MKKSVMICLLCISLAVSINAMERQLTSRKRQLDEVAERVLLQEEEVDIKKREDYLSNSMLAKRQLTAESSDHMTPKDIFVFGMEAGKSMVPIALFRAMQ